MKVLFYAGYENYSSTVDQQDRDFCQPYTASKPSPMPEVYPFGSSVNGEEWMAYASTLS